MNVGIIVYSRTGHTLSVAEKLKGIFLSKGIDASIECVTAHNDAETDIGKIRFSTAPDTSQYDTVIFGAPVHGFSLPVVMRAYLMNIRAFSDQKTACFITQAFPFEWMGGNRAMGQMVGLCKSKGGNPYAECIINWSSDAKREKKTAAAAEQICGLK